MWQVAKCFMVKCLKLYKSQWYAFQSLKDVLITVEDNIFISLTTNWRWDATSWRKLDFDIFASQEHISKIQKSVLITTEENIFIYSNCQSLFKLRYVSLRCDKCQKFSWWKFWSSSHLNEVPKMFDYHTIKHYYLLKSQLLLIHNKYKKICLWYSWYFCISTKHISGTKSVLMTAEENIFIYSNCQSFCS